MRASTSELAQVALGAVTRTMNLTAVNLRGDDGVWRERAACRDTDFTEGIVETTSWGTKKPTRLGHERLAICERCPVLDDCHAWMMSDRLNQLVPGVLAGTLPRQRYGNSDDMLRELGEYDVKLEMT